VGYEAACPWLGPFCAASAASAVRIAGSISLAIGSVGAQRVKSSAMQVVHESVLILPQRMFRIWVSKLLLEGCRRCPRAMLERLAGSSSAREAGAAASGATINGR
jgi:hypothetical protein